MLNLLASAKDAFTKCILRRHNHFNLLQRWYWGGYCYTPFAKAKVFALIPNQLALSRKNNLCCKSVYQILLLPYLIIHPIKKKLYEYIKFYHVKSCPQHCGPLSPSPITSPGALCPFGLQSILARFFSG